MPKISQLPSGSSPTGAETFPAVQGGITYKFTFSQIAGLVARQVVTASSDTIATATTHLLVNRSGPTTTALALPNASLRPGIPLAVDDLSTSIPAAGHTITLTPFQASQKIMRLSTFDVFSSSSNALGGVKIVAVVDPDDTSNYIWVYA